MSSDSLDRKPVFSWYAMAIVFTYLALTLLVAMAARPAAPDEALGGWHAKFIPLVQALPGAGTWQWVLGLDQPPETAQVTGLQTPQVVVIVLASLLALCGSMGRRNGARNARDAEIVREERLKQRTRERMASEYRR